MITIERPALDCRKVIPPVGYCLNCPYTKCIEDRKRDYPNVRYLDNCLRDRDIQERYRKGSTIEMLADIYRLHERQIERIVGRASA